MQFIESLQLTLNTLIIFSVLPFVYFGYHAKYWWHQELLKRYDFFLSFIAVILALVIVIKMARPGPGGRDSEMIKLLLAHLAPLILSLLIVSRGRTTAGRSQGRAPDKKSGEDSFAPAPLNKEIEKLSWDDLIIDPALRTELTSVINLLRDPSTAKKYGIDVPKGILLNGPPGTGKTTIAKVIANTAELSFFALKMDEVVSKWVGESEKNLTKLFNAALKHKPAVTFIDEVDSIGKSRSGGGQQWSENLLNHLLQLIDGVVKAEGLYVIAATNRADLVDEALKRAGRLSKTIEIPLPDFQSRIKLFSLYLAKLALAEGVDNRVLAQVTDGKSAAEIKQICNQAGLNAFKRESATGNKRRNYVVTPQDLEDALAELV